MKRTCRNGILAGAFAAVLTTSTAVLAQEGVTFTYQGELRLNNQPVQGATNFQFTLYDVNAGNQALANSNHNGVNVVNGRFSVELNFGNIDPPVFDGRPLDLGIRVNGGAEMQPRVRIAPAPLAIGLKLPFHAEKNVANPKCVFSVRNTGTGQAICGKAQNASGFLPAVDFQQSAVWGDTNVGNGVTGSTSKAGENAVSGGAGIFGLAKGMFARGVSGQFKDAAANGWGVYGTLIDVSGLNLFPFKSGVIGDTTSGNGVNGLSSMAGAAGVFGKCDPVNSAGVAGTSQNGYGIFGNTENTFAVYGRRNGGTNAAIPAAAIWGDANDFNGLLGTAIGGGNGGAGIHNALSGMLSTHWAGLWGDTNAGAGLLGSSTFATGVGVQGRCDTPAGVGARGTSTFGTAVYADTGVGLGVWSIRGGPSLTNLDLIFMPAIWGDTNSGNGVMGTTSANQAAGVFGKTDNPTAAGVSGKSPVGTGVAGASNTGIGVYGTLLLPSGANVAGVLNPGVWGDSSAGNGVLGTSSAPTGAGVIGIAEGANGAGVVGIGRNGSKAGEFDGDVDITGTITKGAGTFKIDHPLDPANRFLSHSFVESPDMKNIYDGIVQLDDNGRAVVCMPDWFDALNSDFRYSLTALDAPAPNLHVATRMHVNCFTIGGGNPGMEVSWQVTGIRRDAFARAYRTPVESEKADHERGLYLHPEVFGQPESLRLSHAMAQTEAEPFVAPALVREQTGEPQVWPARPGEVLTTDATAGRTPYGPKTNAAPRPAAMPGQSGDATAAPASAPGVQKEVPAQALGAEPAAKPQVDDGPSAIENASTN